MTSASIGLTGLTKDEVFHAAGDKLIAQGVKSLKDINAFAGAIANACYASLGTHVGGSAYVNFNDKGGSLSLSLTFYTPGKAVEVAPMVEPATPVEAAPVVEPAPAVESGPLETAEGAAASEPAAIVEPVQDAPVQA